MAAVRAAAAADEKAAARDRAQRARAEQTAAQAQNLAAFQHAVPLQQYWPPSRPRSPPPELLAEQQRQVEEAQRASDKLRVAGKGSSLSLCSMKIDPSGDVQAQLRDILTANAVRVIDLFRDWDDDNSGMVSKEEFRRGMAEMGLKASTEEVDKVFDAFDPDGSGSVELKEFGRMLRRGSSAKLDKSLQAGAMGAIETKSETKFALRKGTKPEQAGTAVLRGFDLDEDSDESIAAQLRGALMASGARVIDLFREWDADGDGKVTRAEFHRAMGLLRFAAPKAEIDVVFASWDPDGSGVLELKELERLLLLRKGSTVLDAAGEAEARARAREGAAAEAEAAEAAKAAAAAAEVTEVTACVEPGEGEEDGIWVSTPRAEPIEPSVPHQPSPPVPRLPPRSPRQRHMEAVHEP